MQMPPEAWRARVRDRADEAADHCQRAYLLVCRAESIMERPIRAADGDDGRARAMTAEDVLVDAASNLAAAAALLAAAEDVGLRGAARDPAAPLLSFTSIAGVDEPELKLRAALQQIHDARVHTDMACVAIQRGRGHLWAVYQLLDHERLPGVDGLLHNKRVAADKDLFAAFQGAEESLLLARHGRGFVGSARY